MRRRKCDLQHIYIADAHASARGLKTLLAAVFPLPYGSFH